MPARERIRDMTNAMVGKEASARVTLSELRVRASDFHYFPHLFTQSKFLDLHDKDFSPNLHFQNHCMSLKTRQTHGLSHFPLIAHRSCCVFSSMGRREGDGAGRNGCDLTGNTSRSIPAPGLSVPIAGPQLAAACPLQRPRFQPVPITATES